MPEAETPLSETSASQITILPMASRQHLSHVIMLAHRIWPEVYSGILTPEQIDNMLSAIYTPDHLQQEQKQGHQFFLAYRGEVPIAYASTYKDKHIIWLKKLYVDTASQKQRIGVRLMHQAVSHFLPAREIRLLANPNNHPAHTFYQHLGFTKIGEVPVKMGDWEFNDYLFSMPLTEQ